MAEKWSVPLGSHLCALPGRPIPPRIPLRPARGWGRGGEDGAELQFLLEHWKLHFMAEWAGIATPAPHAGRSERR